MYDSVSRFETPKEKEDRLYRESRALKFQAREMRKKRIEKEATEAARLLKRKEEDARLKVEETAKQVRQDRDNRIRTALLSMAEAAKKGQLAFEAPTKVWGFSYTQDVETKDAFILIDQKTGDRVQIRTQHNGFQWD